MHRSTPRAHRTPTLTASPQGKKRKQIARESSSPRISQNMTIKKKRQSTTPISPPGDDRERDEEIEKMVEGDEDEESYASEFVDLVLNDDLDDSGTKIEPGRYKENPKNVDNDDDEIEKEKKDEEIEKGKKDDNVEKRMRKEQKQTPIPSPTRSRRNVSSSDKIGSEELIAAVSPTNATTSKDSPQQNARNDLFHTRQRLYQEMKRSLQDQANDLALHDDHQEDDAPPDGEKRVKRHKTSKSSKSARGSSSKQSDKDSTTYVSKQQHEWGAWVEETVIDEDEVILKDETPKLIAEFQNIDKRVPTIFDRARKCGATLNDMLTITEVVRITTNQPHGLDFMEQIIVMRENNKPNSFSEADFKYLNKNDIEDLYYLCQNKKSDVFSQPSYPNLDVGEWGGKLYTVPILQVFLAILQPYQTISQPHRETSPLTFPKIPNNLSKYLLASLAISPFHDMQAYNVVANKPPIPPQDPISPPAILTPSLVLPPSLLFDPRYFFVSEELLPPKK
ncbi:hypothetical protein Tco_1055894 [Tanacetum coccineum]|uniref:Uncharacterized protein n=1 Tax=Tanacetum coccineum TaxID=301880 RepID=A0ABQ5H2Q9_9ASTR